MALLLANELTERPQTELRIIFTTFLEKVIVNVDAAAAWLTERADLREQREDRIEIVEWAVLLFVAVGVVADILLVLHH